MSVENYQPNLLEYVESIQITDSAAEHFARQLNKSGKQAIRLSLKESGCTGFMYVIEETDDKQVGDSEKTLSNGIRFYIDPSRIVGLKGLQIDYQKQGLNHNLVMNNPNVKDPH